MSISNVNAFPKKRKDQPLSKYTVNMLSTDLLEELESFVVALGGKKEKCWTLQTEYVPYSPLNALIFTLSVVLPSTGEMLQTTVSDTNKLRAVRTAAEELIYRVLEQDMDFNIDIIDNEGCLRHRADIDGELTELSNQIYDLEDERERLEAQSRQIDAMVMQRAIRKSTMMAEKESTNTRESTDYIRSSDAKIADLDTSGEYLQPIDLALGALLPSE